MEHKTTPREDEILRIAEDAFGADAKFAYINHETQKATVLTLYEALQVCRHIVDASDEEIINTLRRMHEMAQKIFDLRARQLAAQALSENQR